MTMFHLDADLYVGRKANGAIRLVQTQPGRGYPCTDDEIPDAIIDVDIEAEAWWHTCANLDEQNTPHPKDHPILRIFVPAHLPPHLVRISREFEQLALFMARYLPQGAEATAGLRKLLEAKDCAVRAELARVRS